jgi:hypothetical protein
MKKLITSGLAAAAIGGALLAAAPAQASYDVFTTCPSGHTGVVGGHTSCAFAENISRAFYASGGASEFIAYSPVTGERYIVTCEGGYRASFDTGGSLIASQCYAGDNAEVVVW